MEMKDAPLVQEEIASSKVKNLRKVAITVAVVALTVCGVAVGMVAAGMESKTVPTLKYTPGTKTTYSHTMKTTQGSTKGQFTQALEVEQYVLSRDAATGATTFMITVPVVVGNVDPEAIAPESELKDTVFPDVAFVVTQAADGTWDLDSAKCQIDGENPAFTAAARSLVHHLRMTAPRLAADATVAELDAFTGLQTDAKYTVNNLEQGTTEVVRTVAPASVQNQVNGPQLAQSQAASVTVKDGEVVASKAYQSAELSAMYEAIGPEGTGEINRYVDQRESFATDASMTKGATETFDLSAFAADLAKFTTVDVAAVTMQDDLSKAPYKIGTGQTYSGSYDIEKVEETAEEERSLLALSASWSTTKWEGKVYETEFSLTVGISDNTSACDKKECSNKSSISFTVGTLNVLCGKDLVGALAISKNKKRPGSKTTVQVTVTITLSLTLKIASNWTMGGLLKTWTLSDNNKKTDDDEGITIDSVPLFKHPLIQLEVGISFNASLSVVAGVHGFKVLGAGKWKCVKKCGSYCNVRRWKNNGGAYTANWNHSIDLPQRNSKWGSAGTPTVFRILKVSSYKRYYCKVDKNFYTDSSSCKAKYSHGLSRFKITLKHNMHFAVTLDTYVQTSCVAGNRIRIGIKITGKFMSFTHMATAYLRVLCWHIDFAQDGATVTITPYIQRRYGIRVTKSDCHKKQYVLKSLTDGFKMTVQMPQAVTDHLAYASYPWFKYPSETSAHKDGGNYSGFQKPLYYSSYCRYSHLFLEPIFGGSRKFNTYA
jgi:hypothetical protein